MIPYPEPYQSEYQQRRLGALGIEWRPSSLKLAVGPDFSLDPDYQMLPLADLDLLAEPLPEFMDAMDWEPEIVVKSDGTDSEYNVPNSYSSGREQGCSSSNASGDPECSTNDSEGEDTYMDGIRKSKRKNQKIDMEIMTSSGRRVKRRNLEECDGNTSRNIHGRKGKSVWKPSSRRKSSKLKSARPQRAAARNALHLFSKITGTPTDGEEDSLDGDFSDSESTLLESTIESDESARDLQIDQRKYSKGKEVSLDESEYIKSHELSENHTNAMNRRRLVLKLPVRDSSKLVLETTVHKFENEAELVASSSNTAQEATDVNRNRSSSTDLGYYSGGGNYQRIERTDQVKLDHEEEHVDLFDGYMKGKIRWGVVRARTSKHLRVGDALSSDANARSVKCVNDLNEKENVGMGHEKENKAFATLSPSLDIQNDKDKVDSLTEINEKSAGTTSEAFIASENGKELTSSSNFRDKDESLYSVCVIAQDANVDSISHCSGADRLPEPNISFPSVSTKLRSKRSSRDPESPFNFKHETKSSVVKNVLCSSHVNNLNKEQSMAVAEYDTTTRITSNQGENRAQEIDARVDNKITSLDSLEPHSHKDNRYKAVYRRSRSHRSVANSGDGGIRGECTSNGIDNNLNVAVEFINGTNEADHTNGSTQLEPTTFDPDIVQNNLKVHQGNEYCTTVGLQNGSMNIGQPKEERGSSSKLTVGMRSTRSRRASYHIRETSPSLINRRKSIQSTTKRSWLLLSTHEEGCRYIPQQGDEVVYMRQGHQEYIEYSGAIESGPWTSLKGHIRAVECCKAQNLEYSTVPGSGDSCCKLTLQFIDPNSSMVGKCFKLTLPEVTSFPDFLVERTRFDAAMQRNWTHRDKCRVWWKNESDFDGNWWDGRILGVKPKSSEFADSPWERYTVRYKSDPTETHLHSPWELFDADTQWEQPHIDDESRNKVLSAFTKLRQSGNTNQDRYGVQELKKISNKSKFLNRFPVPLSLELIQSRLENNYYRTFEALRYDITVLLSNASLFFEKDAELSAKMRRLSEWFTRMLSSL